MKTKYSLLIGSLFSFLVGNAQELTSGPQMADTFRSEGKIYVVIAVMSIIFLCIISYLIYIDIKLKKIENK